MKKFWQPSKQPTPEEMQAKQLRMQEYASKLQALNDEYGVELSVTQQITISDKKK